MLVLLQAAQASAAAPGAAKGQPRLGSMQIQIWPEYDRPAALVILKAELAADALLPADVSLRIPASSGGPAAVAYASAENGELSNLKYDRSDAKDFITLRFSVPDRFFHVEFYDHFLTGASERDYKYAWPGDLPVGQLSVVIQEPAGASDLSVRPDLGESAAGAEGLRYRSAQLGSFDAGKQLPIEIRYTKTDARPSAEILKLNPAAAVPVTSRETATAAPSRLLLALGIALPLILAAMAGYFLWRRRARSAAERGPGFCSQCGHRIAPGDRFCSKCGAALA
jgi:zinc-ribbon domain